jgi:hypothetical protein
VQHADAVEPFVLLHRIGIDPVAGVADQEQLKQMFTILVSLRPAKLMDWHSEARSARPGSSLAATDAIVP